MISAAIQRAVAAANVNAAVATSQIFAALNASPITQPVVPCILTGPGSNRLEQKRFKVTASGIATTAGAFTVLPSLYAALVTPATPFNPASWTLLGAGAATAVGTTTAGWDIEAELMFDSVSGKLMGEFSSNVNNSYVAKAAIANQVAGIVGATEPALVFAVGLTFSAANVGNIGKLADFCLGA